VNGAVASGDDATETPAAHGEATSGGNAAGRCHSGNIHAVVDGVAISDGDATERPTHRRHKRWRRGTETSQRRCPVAVVNGAVASGDDATDDVTAVTLQNIPYRGSASIHLPL
jgi:hypothetical protein